ncbi:hypothetical protein VTL71DRAFT_9233 [Oculimacula yallundae]|uniref:CHAT domain-containing protein n=1 Tax=Oculimacula yallundae TaxID=86028 RepID=A0ABR4BSF6_9HELO
MEKHLVLQATHYDTTQRRWDINIQGTDGSKYATGTVHNPFSDTEEEELRWYLEDFAFKDPFAKRRATAVEDNLTRYRSELFSSLEDLLLPAIFQDDCDLPVMGVRLYVEDGDQQKSIHCLHWECLEDCSQDYDDMPPIYVSRKCVNSREAAEASMDVSEDTRNILFISSRAETDRIPYRMLSKPIWELINSNEALKARIKVYFARPGTWAQFKSLLEPTKQHPKGFFSMVHFDTHGIVHKKAGPCLMFTSSNGSGQGEYVQADKIAEVLFNAEAHTVILNACNTASATEKWPQSLAMKFVCSGIANVVAMSFAVTAQSASIFILDLYENHFLRRKPLSQSVAIARRKLQDTNQRRSRFAVGVGLDDRLVPVLYQNYYKASDENTNLQSIAGSEITELSPVDAISTTDHQEIPGQIIGRDMKMLAMELDFTIVGAIILTGRAGVGKTAFSRLIGEWWASSGFFTDCIRISFEDLRACGHATTALYILIATKAAILSTDQDAKAAVHQSRVLIVIDQLPSIIASESVDKDTSDLISRLVDDFEDSTGLETSRLLLIARHMPEFLSRALIKNVPLGPLAMEYTMELSRQRIIRSGGVWKEDRDAIQGLRRLLLDHDSNCLFIETFLPLLGQEGYNVHDLRDQLRLDLPAGSDEVLSLEFGSINATDNFGHNLYAEFTTLMESLHCERFFASAMLTCIALFHGSIPAHAQEAIISAVYDAYSLQRAIILSLEEDTGVESNVQRDWPPTPDIEVLKEDYRYLMKKLEEIDLVSPSTSSNGIHNIHVYLPYLIRHNVQQHGSDYISPEDAKQIFWRYHDSILRSHTDGETSPDQAIEDLFGANRTNIQNALRLFLQQRDWHTETSCRLAQYLIFDARWALESDDSDYSSLLQYTVSRYEELFQDFDQKLSSHPDADELLSEALLFVYLQGKYMSRHLMTVLDQGAKERFEKDQHNNVLRAHALWEIGLARRCTNPNSRTIYQVIGWMETKVSPEPVEERKIILLEDFRRSPEAGTNDFFHSLHTEGKSLLVVRYLADSELQQVMRALPEDVLTMILSQPAMTTLDASVLKGITQYLTGADNSKESAMKMIVAASKVAPGIMGDSLENMAAMLPDQTSKSKKRIMVLMERAQNQAKDGHELAALRGVFDSAAAEDDYDSALDCHKRMLVLEDATRKQYTTESASTPDGSRGEREYQLGRILAESHGQDPQKAELSREHFHKALVILRQCPAWSNQLILLLHDMASGAWDSKSDSYSIEDICASLRWNKESVQVEHKAPGSIEAGPLSSFLFKWMLSNSRLSHEKGMMEEALSRTADLSVETIQMMLEICATQAATESGWGEAIASSAIGKELEHILFLEPGQIDLQTLRFWHRDATDGNWRVKKKVYDGVSDDWREVWFASMPLPEYCTNEWREERRIYPYSYSSPIIQRKKMKHEMEAAKLVQEELD